MFFSIASFAEEELDLMEERGLFLENEFTLPDILSSLSSMMSLN